MCGGGKVHREFWLRNLRERDHLEERSIEGTIILIWIFKKWDGSMDWIDLAQNRERSRSSVKAVINCRFPQNRGNFFTSLEPVSFSARTLLHGVSWLGRLGKCDQSTTWTNGGVWVRFLRDGGIRRLFLNISVQIGSGSQVDPCRVGISLRVKRVWVKMDGRSNLVQNLGTRGTCMGQQLY